MTLARHDRIEAAKLEGFTAFPLVRFAHLTEAPMRADVITDNKIAEQVAARFAGDDAPRRRHSGPADGPFLTTSPLSGCETVNASGGNEEACLVQTAVAWERGNVR
jgi:hypothetical protein